MTGTRRRSILHAAKSSQMPYNATIKVLYVSVYVYIIVDRMIIVLVAF